MKPLKNMRLLQGDPVIWTVFFLLCMISLIEVYSAASSLSYKSGDYLAPLIKQALFLSVGTGVVWTFHNIPCRYFKLIPVAMWPLCIILLLFTLFFGTSENDGQRWINLGLFNFQPSELAKGVVITATALILGYTQTPSGADSRAFKHILVIAGSICALIFPENLSTAVILFGTVFIMMFIGRVPLKQLGKLVGFFAGIGALVIVTVAVLPESTVKDSRVLHRFSTWESRLSNHGTEEMNDTVFLRDRAQEAHAAIAIASSNVVGKMPGNSDQRDRLSQAFSDFIYAIIIEEMGITGAVLVVFLYVILLFRAGRIASRCERNFPAFLTLGFAILLVSQAMLNMLVAVGIAPVTGQPLPLISRGGTSTIINCVYFGMMLSVSRYARRTPEEGATPAEEAPAEEANAELFQSHEGMA